MWAKGPCYLLSQAERMKQEKRANRKVLESEVLAKASLRGRERKEGRITVEREKHYRQRGLR
jgi:hypothetical protein